MFSKELDKEKLVDTEKYSTSVRIRGSVIKRLSSVGKIGTIVSELADKFSILVSKEKFNNRDQVTSSNDGSILYATKISDGIYHVTVKQGSDNIVVELSGSEIKDHVLNLVDLLNSSEIKLD